MDAWCFDSGSVNLKKARPNKFVYYNFAEESAVPTVNFSLHVAS